MAMTFPLVPGVPVTAQAQIARICQDPGFGVAFSDHMATATWTASDGWGDDRLEANQPFPIAPGSAVLHYAQEVFEGLKAYRRADDSIWLFRPELNAHRFNRSAQRLALPEIPEADFLAAVRAVVKADAAWVPRAEEFSLYLRPFAIADEAFLGVHAATKVKFAVIAGPAGPYFASGVKPVDIWLTTTYSRAGHGGTGAAKCGGNYASSLLAGQEAADHGCSQVLFTDAATHTWLEELGGMNVFIITAAGRLVTPPTSGTILAGITRASILTLAAEFGLIAEERPISRAELLDGIGDGSISEIFACGTAAVVTPIGALKYATPQGDITATVRQGCGERTRAIRSRLVDIQWGRQADPYGWTTRVL